MYKIRYTPTKRSRSWVKRISPLVRWYCMKWLDARNRLSVDTVVQTNGPVVSLTTFAPRWNHVYYTLESIGSGTVRPSRLILWVAPSVLQMGTPEELVRLQRRGLEILACEDLGPHKKYFPAVNLLTCDRPLVTADDDVIYPADWLEKMLVAAARLPECVLAHRVRTIVFTPEGEMAPYVKWSHCSSAEPSPLHVAVGMGGVLYPPVLQQAMRDAGDRFKVYCPRADDIWLKAVALHTGVDVAQVGESAPLLVEVPGMRESGLARHNLDERGNDAQIRNTFSTADVEFLLKTCKQRAKPS